MRSNLTVENEAVKFSQFKLSRISRLTLLLLYTTHMRSFVFVARVFLLAQFAGVAPAAVGQPELKPPLVQNNLPPPGTIISETSRRIRFEYKEVSRSVINDRNHWEGVGHFSYVYYRDQELCQCSGHEVLISPDGTHAIFVNASSGKLVHFRARAGVRTALSKKYIGHPKRATWESGQVKITVEMVKGSTITTKTINVAL